MLVVYTIIQTFGVSKSNLLLLLFLLLEEIILLFSKDALN